MRRLFYQLTLLCVVVLVLAGCGEGLKKDGKLPLLGVFGLQSGDTRGAAVEPNPEGGVLLRIHLDGTFGDLEQRLSATPIRWDMHQIVNRVTLDGAVLPDTISVTFRTRGVTIQDRSAEIVLPDKDLGTLVLTRQAGTNQYTVQAVANGGLLASWSGVDAAELPRVINNQIEPNTVSGQLVGIVQSTPSLPAGTVMEFTFGLGTGTLTL